MEGLNSAVAVTFLLTTNRADLLEPALAARPGRVDLAAELPLPDDEARRTLLRLYQGDLVLDEISLDSVITRTDGVTAAHLDAALDKLPDSRSQLTRALLGAQSPPGEAAGPAR
jgi:ATP-dependent 26S proteasome regulatory subunit